MSWLFYAFVAIFVFVFSTYIDKFLLAKYFAGKSPGVLILFSSLFGAVVTPILYFVAPEALTVETRSAVLLLVGGLLNIAGVICYLYAVHQDDVSVVAPLFQLSPLFALLLGYFFLGEALVGRHIIGFFLVLVGTLIVSVDFSARKANFKKSVFFLMAAATLLISINTAIFKVVALEEQFWASMFWEYAALVVAGIILLVFVRHYREQFFALFKKGAGGIIALNVTNEITGVIGYLLISYASLLAPIALVSVVGGTQPFFLFLFGALFTFIAPHLINEKISRKIVVQKLSAAVVIFVGIYLLR